MIRHQRRKMSLTLEEGAEGICSISYLSKVENNQIIPSDKYLELFQQKFEISLDKLFDKNDQLIIDLIDAIFIKNKQAFSKEDFKGFDYRSKLFYLATLILLEQYLDAKKAYFELNPYIKNMNDLELSLYLYLSATLLEDEGRLSDAFTLLRMNEAESTNFKLKMLIETKKIILACKMDKHPYVSMYFDEILSELISHEYYHLVHEIKFIYLSYMTQFFDQKRLYNEFEKSLNITAEQRNYLLIKYLYRTNEYNKSEQLLEKIHFTNSRTYLLASIILNRLNKKEKIKTLLQHKIDTNNAHERLIIEYLKLKHVENSSHLDQFIRIKILKQYELADSKDILMFWYEEGVNTFKKGGYYKDATILC